MSDLKAFRASPETSAAIAAAARREGVSQSAIMRCAIERRLGLSSPDADQDVYALVRDAARGELQAQRELTRVALGNALRAVKTDASDKRGIERGFVEALSFARLAAGQGGHADQAAILSILSLMETHCPGSVDQGDMEDALGRLDVMADEGVSDATEALAALVDCAPRQAVPALRDGGKNCAARLRSTVPMALRR